MTELRRHAEHQLTRAETALKRIRHVERATINIQHGSGSWSKLFESMAQRRMQHVNEPAALGEADRLHQDLQAARRQNWPEMNNPELAIAEARRILRAATDLYHQMKVVIWPDQ